MDMETTTLLKAIGALVLYLAAGGLLALRLFRGDTGAMTAKAGLLAVAFGGVILHAAVLHPVVFTSAGLDLSFFRALSLTAWTVVLVLLVSSITKPVENLGILLLPLAALTLFLDLANPPMVGKIEPMDWGLKAHILVSILGYGLLTLAAVQAVLIAIQDRHLRNHHPGGFIRALPPLQTMETLLFEMVAVGFALLSLSLFSGAAFLEDMFAQSLVHKTLLSIASWVVFGLLLWGRFRHGWRGRTAIRWTLSGFVVLALAYFGSKLVLELILQR